MCTPANLRLIFMALTLLKGIQMVFMFSFGIIVAMDIKLHQAYGVHIKAIGIGVALMAVYGSGNMSIGLKGSFLHNKFLLLLHLILDSIALLIQVYLGSELLFVTLTEFDTPNYRETCAKSDLSASSLTIDDCMPYIQSERTSGFQIVWRSYYYESGQNAEYYQKIIAVQREGQCCGFGPPKRCIAFTEDAYDFPHNNEFDPFYRLTTENMGEGWGLYVKNR